MLEVSDGDGAFELVGKLAGRGEIECGLLHQRLELPRVEVSPNLGVGGWRLEALGNFHGHGRCLQEKKRRGCPRLSRRCGEPHPPMPYHEPTPSEAILAGSDQARNPAARPCGYPRRGVFGPALKSAFR